MKPTYILANGMKPFIFVVPPLDLEVITSQKTEKVDIISFGEKIKTGERNSETISFSTFLPNVKSPFYSITNPLLPMLAVELLKKWKNQKKVLTFIVPEYLISIKCKIINLNYSIRERTGDIDINITLTEDRTQSKEPNLLTGLFERL